MLQQSFNSEQRHIVLVKSSVDTFLRSCNNLVSNIDSFVNTSRPVAGELIEECDEIINQFPEIRVIIAPSPAVTKRSFNFLQSLFVTCKNNIEQISKRPDLQLLKNRLVTNNAQLKKNISSFSVMIID